MSKRKLTADEAVADILLLVDNESDVDDDKFNDDLDKIYDSDDLNPAQQDRSDDEDSSDSDGDVEIDIQKLLGKILTKKRLVSSIDKSLDENCYDRHDFGVAEDLPSEKVLQVFLSPKKKYNTKKIFCTNKKLPNASRQRACDVLPRTPQPLTLLPLASGIDSSNDAFKILFPDQMVQLIVDKINTKIKHIKDNLPAYYNKSDKITFIRPFDQREFHAFISLFYACGHFGQSMHTCKMLFSEAPGYPVFSANMLKHKIFISLFGYIF